MVSIEVFGSDYIRLGLLLNVKVTGLVVMKQGLKIIEEQTRCMWEISGEGKSFSLGL